MVDPRNVSRSFTRILNRTNLPKIRLHDLRKSAGSLLLDSGESLKAISELLGHSSIRVTSDLYLQTGDRAKKRMADTMDSLYDEGAG